MRVTTALQGYLQILLIEQLLIGGVTNVDVAKLEPSLGGFCVSDPFPVCIPSQAGEEALAEPAQVTEVTTQLIELIELSSLRSTRLLRA